jgi:hypothetical protein
MTTDTVIWLSMAALGAVFMFHCPRAAIRELRSGVARGRYGPYPRESAPVGFWITILATFLAGLMGLSFFTFALVGLFYGLPIR